MKLARELFSLMLREYNEALREGCDSNGAYDCMVEAGSDFLKKLEAANTRGPLEKW